jgi:hypothetical protein
VRRPARAALAAGAAALLALGGCRAAPPPPSPAPDAAAWLDRSPDALAAVRAIAARGGDSSRVADDLRHLTDVIGPRLTGSESSARAAAWGAARFRALGADSVWTEPWTLARAWTRGPVAVRLVAPHVRALEGASVGWSPGTDGPVAGDVLFVDARSEGELGERFGARLRGAWVMLRAPLPMPPADGAPLTAADSAALVARRREVLAPSRSDEERAFVAARPRLLAAMGAAGILHSGDKEGGLLTMYGSPLVDAPLPQLVLPHESFAMLHRLLAAGERPRLEARIDNAFSAGPVAERNVLAELRGRERPDEVVLVAAHLDSWDLGTGASDDGAGVVAVLEAARILKESGARPRRTIRFALFGGEEQGLLGSRAYAASHRAELGRWQGVVVLDNGTGRITGMTVQGRDDLVPLWRALFEPIGALGPFAVKAGRKGGTDHLAFTPFGVPGFNYDQLPRGYDRTYHSGIDTFDHAFPGDLAQAAAVMAATAYQLADAPRLLPRNPAP